MDRGYGDRRSFNIDPGADQLLDRTKGTAAELSCDLIGACWIFVDHSDQFNGVQFAGELVIDAGMVAPECAYANDGNGNGIWAGQWGSGTDFRLKISD